MKRNLFAVLICAVLAWAVIALAGEGSREISLHKYNKHLIIFEPDSAETQSVAFYTDTVQIPTTPTYYTHYVWTFDPMEVDTATALMLDADSTFIVVQLMNSIDKLDWTEVLGCRDSIYDTIPKLKAGRAIRRWIFAEPTVGDLDDTIYGAYWCLKTWWYIDSTVYDWRSSCTLYANATIEGFDMAMLWPEEGELKTLCWVPNAE